MPAYMDEAAAIAERVFFEEAACRADWEKTIDRKAIGAAWARQIITNPRNGGPGVLKPDDAVMAMYMTDALSVFGTDDDVAALGARLGCNLSWAAWQDNWWNAYLGGDSNAH